MKRISFFTYGIICYAIFLTTFLYAIGFVGNLLVPKSLDAIPTLPLVDAMLINFGLLGVFAIQHSVMARPTFKRWWMRFVPQPVERSTYVLFSSLALAALFVFWQPMGGQIWEVENTIGQIVLYGLFAFGWGLVLVSTFLINHFDLFGLQQVWFFLRRKPIPSPQFVAPGPYKLVRHPLYLGFLLAFWATPAMTVTHLLFAVVTTVYILAAIRLEERNLTDDFGGRYRAYQQQVPMIIPSVSRQTGIRHSDSVA
ncbi:MAG: methanethiol S-methyltransferase [Pseudomonadota bacterium]